MGEKFTFNYSGSSQEDIKKLREKYEDTIKKEDSRIARIRKLDKRVEISATIPCIIAGVIGLLFLGASLSIILDSNAFDIVYVSGLVIGVIGIAIMAVNPALSRFIKNRSKEKYGPEILRLLDLIEKDSK